MMPNKAILLALSCVVAWSFIPVISKVTTADITPLQFLFLSNALSAMMIGCVLIAWRIKIQGIFLQLKSSLLATILPAFLGCFLYYLCLYYGYSKADGVTVLVIQYLWPVLIVLLAPLILREKITSTIIASALLGFIGTLVVATKGDFSTFEIKNLPILGIVFIGSLAFALFSLLSKKIRCHTLVATFLYFIWATLFSLIGLLASSGIKFPASGNAWLGLVLNGTIVNGLSYFWWLRALQLEQTSRIAPLVFLTPILACLWLVLFLNEIFYISYVVGLCMCVGAGILASRNRSP
ncbi:DMT family transporter [Glaciimonas immobilis]|uniref:Drug/metabolite transporter (DMT)-like permease n=1 Tax=Glaciimonas immobilis TaxID=728004 RepID=A0A840RNF8_9BURK|nr:DMT family transporter [Glaciimonas immobilis]KAF3997035.1 DMT family transporter [Glaciimonas immobilis]MBB5199877.1 drug/metabolite transporter (DMT)-like permease [Glaciimonas immobilis]